MGLRRLLVPSRTLLFAILGAILTYHVLSVVLSGDSRHTAARQAQRDDLQWLDELEEQAATAARHTAHSFGEDFRAKAKKRQTGKAEAETYGEGEEVGRLRSKRRRNDRSEFFDAAEDEGDTSAEDYTEARELEDEEEEDYIEVKHFPKLKSFGTRPSHGGATGGRQGASYRLSTVKEEEQAYPQERKSRGKTFQKQHLDYQSEWAETAEAKTEGSEQTGWDYGPDDGDAEGADTDDNTDNYNAVDDDEEEGGVNQAILQAQVRRRPFDPKLYGEDFHVHVTKDPTAPVRRSDLKNTFDWLEDDQSAQGGGADDEEESRGSSDRFRDNVPLDISGGRGRHMDSLDDGQRDRHVDSGDYEGEGDITFPISDRGQKQGHGKGRGKGYGHGQEQGYGQSQRQGHGQGLHAPREAFDPDTAGTEGMEAWGLGGPRGRHDGRSPPQQDFDGTAPDGFQPGQFQHGLPVFDSRDKLDPFDSFQNERGRSMVEHGHGSSSSKASHTGGGANSRFPSMPQLHYQPLDGVRNDRHPGDQLDTYDRAHSNLRSPGDADHLQPYEARKGQGHNERADIDGDTRWGKYPQLSRDGATGLGETRARYEGSREAGAPHQQHAASAVKKVLFLGYRRGGSSIASEVFDTDDRATFFYEPLDSFYFSETGYKGKKSQKVILNKPETDFRRPEPWETIKLPHFFDDLLGCRLEQLPTETLMHRNMRYTSPLDPYVDCYNDYRPERLFNQDMDNLRAIIGPMCGQSVETALRQGCHDVMNAVHRAGLYYRQQSGGTPECLIREFLLDVGYNSSYIDERMMTMLEARQLLDGIEDTIGKCLPLALQGCRSKRIRVTKIVRYTMPLMKHVVDAIDGVKVLYFIRDPRAMAYSRANRKLDRILVNNTRRVCLAYRRDLPIVREIQRSHPGSVKVVRYEDFAAQPQSVAKEMYGLIEEAPPASLNKFIRTHMYAQSDDGRKWGNIRSNASEAASRWRMEIKPDILSTMETMCCDVIKALGYPLYTVS